MSPLLCRLRSVRGAAAEPHSTELDTIFHQTTFNSQTTSSYLQLDRERERERVGMGARQKETINTRVIKYIRLVDKDETLLNLLLTSEKQIEATQEPRTHRVVGVRHTRAYKEKSNRYKRKSSSTRRRRSWMMGWGWRMKTYITIKLIPTTDSVG